MEITESVLAFHVWILRHEGFYMHWNVNISDLFDLPGSAPSSIFDVKENDDGSNSPNGLFTTYRYFKYMHICSYISQCYKQNR